MYRATESVPSKNQKVKSERLCSVTYLASHKGTGKLYHTLRQTSACQIQPGSLQDTLTHIYISKKERKNWRKIRSIDTSLFSTDDFKDKISHTHIKSLPQDWLCFLLGAAGGTMKERIPDRQFSSRLSVLT